MSSGIAIAGIIIGVILILVIVAVIVFICNPSISFSAKKEDENETKAEAEVEQAVGTKADALEAGDAPARRFQVAPGEVARRSLAAGSLAQIRPIRSNSRVSSGKKTSYSSSTPPLAGGQFPGYAFIQHLFFNFCVL